MQKFLDQIGLSHLIDSIRTTIIPDVLSSRKINGKTLDEDITLTASDVGAITREEVIEILTRWSGTKVKL